MVVPSPGTLRAWMVPSCASMIRLQIAMPNPVPACFVV